MDTNKWNFREDSSFSSQQQAQNVSVQDGKLRIALRVERDGKKNYTGGGVISRREFVHGYYEANFKVPASRGWHTSFWTLAISEKNPKQIGGIGPHELDICEHDSYKHDEYKRSLWMRRPKPGSNSKPIGSWNAIAAPDLTANFHIWGCEFTPPTLRYFFELREIERWDVSNYEHGKQLIFLSSVAAKLGANGKTGAPVDQELPAYAEFDDVRLYEKQ